MSSQEFPLNEKESIKESQFKNKLKQENWKVAIMLLELNTLSAKTSISRKEELLAQIDKEMMTLAQKTNKSIRKHLGVVLVNNYYRGFYSVQKTVGFAFNVRKFNSSWSNRFLNIHGQQNSFQKRFGMIWIN